MELYQSLFDIAKLLLAEDDGERTAEVLLRRVLELTGAQRGFIVVREGTSFETRFDVRFDRGSLTDEEQHFSKSLVQHAIKTRQLIQSANLPEHSELARMESVMAVRDRTVMVVPLHHGNEDVWGVVYVEHPSRGPLPDDVKRFLTEFGGVAALCLRRASEREALRQRTQSLERDLFAQNDFQGIVTQHPAMVELLQTVAQVADSAASILVAGETGTGKELVARALHVNSSRRSKPFVALHCTALPGTVLESELFGHARGAFTGADRDRVGRIASAHGGTLFLDEVAEIPMEVQAKLLRFLQFGEIQRLGSDRVDKVDVRIVAATHQDLPAMIQAGKFRLDLYFRLRVVELKVPALRDRRTDIPLLVEHYTAKSWRRPGETPRWEAKAQRILAGYEWPGNVRELAHVVERACLLARGPDLGTALFPPELAGATSAETSECPFTSYTSDQLEAAREAAVAAVDRQFLDGLMKQAEGNVSLAARQSGLHRSYLQKLLARHRG